jgi:hypothetical protein
MADEPKRERGRGWIVVATIALLLASYVLSIGPVHWAFHRNLISGETVVALEPLYMPHDWLRWMSADFSRLLDWYCTLW